MNIRRTHETTSIAPATSEVPLAELPPDREVVVPHPNVAGGLDNIPEDLLPDKEQLQDELDHAGLDEALPGEDQAPEKPILAGTKLSKR